MQWVSGGLCAARARLEGEGEGGRGRDWCAKVRFPWAMLTSLYYQLRTRLCAPVRHLFAISPPPLRINRHQLVNRKLWVAKQKEVLSVTADRLPTAILPTKSSGCGGGGGALFRLCQRSPCMT